MCLTAECECFVKAKSLESMYVFVCVCKGGGAWGGQDCGPPRQHPLQHMSPSLIKVTDGGDMEAEVD